MSHGVKITLPDDYRNNRKPGQRGDPYSPYRYCLLSRYIHTRQQKGESGSSTIHCHTNRKTYKSAYLGYDTANLITCKAKRLVQILIAEMRLPIYSAGRIGNVEVLAA